MCVRASSCLLTCKRTISRPTFVEEPRAPQQERGEVVRGDRVGREDEEEEEEERDDHLAVGGGAGRVRGRRCCSKLFGFFSSNQLLSHARSLVSQEMKTRRSRNYGAIRATGVKMRRKNFFPSRVPARRDTFFTFGLVCYDGRPVNSKEKPSR